MQKYSEILNKIEASKKGCHLLLGNGFVNSLGIKTDYKSIFLQMQEDEPSFKKLVFNIKNKNYDVEQLLLALKSDLNKVESNKEFIKEFVENNVKADFMKAASRIVKEKIKHVRQEKTSGVSLLFKNYTNYLSLNYDHALFILLLKIVKSKSEVPQAICFKNTIKFVIDKLNKSEKAICTEINKAYDDGKLTIQVGNNQNSIDFNKNQINKSAFRNIVRIYYKEQNTGWNHQDIDRASSFVWDEHNSNTNQLDVNYELFTDQQQSDYEYLINDLLFLHGTFHINMRKVLKLKKTSKDNKHYIDQLIKYIQSTDNDVVCIASNSNIGTSSIYQYNKESLLTLSGLKGNIIILGSTFENNDKSIYKAIEESSIDKVFIPSSINSKEKDFKLAKDLFSTKEIILFDYETISYSKTEKD